MNNLGKIENYSYQPCLISKAIRSAKTPMKGTDWKTQEPLQLVHSDVCDTIYPVSMGGDRYFVTLYDDYTAVSAVRFMDSIKNTVHRLKEMIAELNTAAGNQRVNKI